MRRAFDARFETSRPLGVAPPPPTDVPSGTFRSSPARTTKALVAPGRLALGFPAAEPAARARRIFDVVFAGVALLASAPLLAALYVVHHALEGRQGPFLYRGIRLGLHRRPFVIFKIRTLAPGAERELGAALHVPNGRFETRFGRFLRSTRLDELPQLWNVMRGEMSVVGPRPERPEVYDRYRDRIPDYATRFDTKPGLTGLSQLVTPHGAPKRLRALLDRRFARARRSPLWEARVILATVPVMALGPLRELSRLARHRRAASAAGPGADRRLSRRTSGSGMSLWPRRTGLPVPRVERRWRLLDVNHEAMCVATQRPLDMDRMLDIVVEVPNWRTGRTKRARCRALVYRERAVEDLAPGERAYVLFYEPLTELQRYLFEQYVLKASLRGPRRS